MGTIQQLDPFNRASRLEDNRSPYPFLKHQGANAPANLTLTKRMDSRHEISPVATNRLKTMPSKTSLGIETVNLEEVKEDEEDSKSKSNLTMEMIYNQALEDQA